MEQKEVGLSEFLELVIRQIQKIQSDLYTAKDGAEVQLATILRLDKENAELKEKLRLAEAPVIIGESPTEAAGRIEA